MIEIHYSLNIPWKSISSYSLISMRLIYYFDTSASIWHFSSISEDLHRFARNLQHLSAKLFLLLFLNNFVLICCKSSCANLHKYWNNAMTNDGSSIEIIDQVCNHEVRRHRSKVQIDILLFALCVKK